MSHLDYKIFDTDLFHIKKEMDGDDLLSTHCTYIYDSDNENYYCYTFCFSISSASVSYFRIPKIFNWEIKLKKIECDHILNRNHFF